MRGLLCVPQSSKERLRRSRTESSGAAPAIEELPGIARQCKARRAACGFVSTDFRLLTGARGLEGARPSSSPDYYFFAEVQHIAAIPFAFCRSWNFSLRYCLSAANQLTDYVYDETGLLREILSKYRGEEKVDRKIAREYDALDRLVKVTYDGRDVETFCYDTWGKVISSSRNGRKASYRYDYFGRLVEKNEDGVITRSSYNAWGQRTGRETVNGSLKLTETREYDALGRLSKIRNGSGGELTYHYDNLNRLVKQTVNGVPVEYSYDKYGRLVRKALMGFSGSPAVSELKYFYDPDGTIIAREVNGVRQAYKYDRRGQLLEVVGQERYAYDPAGNILSKTVNGVTTTYRYDRANQLVSSETEGKVTKYAYDAAGRLVKEGNKSYTYAWLDKLVSVSEAGKVSANFSYHFDGQIAGVTYADGRRENYLWDGLALIHRDGTELLNEPAVTGGNPVLSGDKVLFNDMLGNTLGVKGKDAYQPIKMTAFGESDNVDAFFTGKPLVGELGYAFLFRNYRPEQGKWQTADPLGYPDGWNNFAYVNNAVTMAIDWLGGLTMTRSDSVDTTSLATWSAGDPVSGNTLQRYTITVDYSAKGDTIDAGAVLTENMGASWTQGPFVYVSTASITLKRFDGSPKISYITQEGKQYKVITQDYVVYVETKLTRTGGASTSNSTSKRYSFKLSVTVPE